MGGFLLAFICWSWACDWFIWVLHIRWGWVRGWSSGSCGCSSRLIQIQGLSKLWVCCQRGLNILMFCLLLKSQPCRYQTRPITSIEKKVKKIYFNLVLWQNQGFDRQSHISECNSEIFSALIAYLITRYVQILHWFVLRQPLA